MNKYYPGGPFNIHIQAIINIIHNNNWLITTKIGSGKIIIISWQRRMGYSCLRTLPQKYRKFSTHYQRHNTSCVQNHAQHHGVSR